jgi:cbb3-type cytochrome oxidase maturation protein
MESLYFLVPCALIFIAIALKVLFWAINNGQYDNLEGEAQRILFDEQPGLGRSLAAEPCRQDPAQNPPQDLSPRP